MYMTSGFFKMLTNKFALCPNPKRTIRVQCALRKKGRGLRFGDAEVLEGWWSETLCVEERVDRGGGTYV